MLTLKIEEKLFEYQKRNDFINEEFKDKFDKGIKELKDLREKIESLELSNKVSDVEDIKALKTIYLYKLDCLVYSIM